LRDHQRFAQEALGLFHELDDRRGEALLLLTMAYAAADRRQTAQAEEHGRRALALFRRQGDRRSEAWALRGIALALAPAGRTPEAGILYSQALDNALSMGDNGILPELYRGHAEVLLALDQAPAALAAAEKGVASVAPDDGYSRTTTYRALGLARLACGDCPGAIDALQQSLAAATPDTYPLEYARSCWAQAALLDRAGRLADAGRMRADALGVVESLVWSESPIPPPEDLLTLARHDARHVP
jgi:tetratricopeptide (TPR) repeat protein